MKPEEQGLDLYEDILVEDLTCQQESLHEVQIKYQEALRRITVLEEITRQNETDILDLKKKNTYLMKNISVLYKTACTELERKKEVIESLRNQLASGFEYEYAEDCRSRIPAYPYSNIFEPQNIEDHRFNEENLAPYDNSRWEAPDPNLQFSDLHTFYSSHSSNVPNNAITASNTDTHNCIQGSQSPYSSSNIPNKERPEKHTSQSKPHKSHTAHITESTLTDSHTPPARNTDSHNNARDSSSHASHSRYADEHTPHTKQTDSSMSHGKHSSSRLSSKKHSGSKSSHSKRPRSKIPTSSPSDKRSSSSKRSHSDSRKHNTHRSGSRTSEPHSSQSKRSESKKSGRSSKISSKDHEPSSSSSSSKSRRGQSHSAERGDTKPAKSSRRSGSSDNKHQDSRSDKWEQKVSVQSCSAKNKNSATSKRKLPQEFSLLRVSKSKPKRKHKEKAKLPKQSVGQSSETEQHLKSHAGGEEENLCEENSKYKNLSLRETDSQVNKENSNLHVLRYNSFHESPTITGQDLTLELDQDMPVELTGLPFTDRLVDVTPQTVTESQSLESVTREADDTTTTKQKSTSSTSGNSSHESDIAEKDLDKCEELDIETNEPCNSILWASKNLSDSDENSVCLEDGTASEVDKLESLSDTLLKEEQSDHDSDISDNKSDTSSDDRKRSIVIQCFGATQDDSRSPIIIPCYPSKKSKSCSSVSDSDEDCDSESNMTSTPSRSLIVRSLFPLNDPTSEESPKMGEGSMTPDIKAKRKIVPALDNSKTCKDKDECLGKANPEQASEESRLSGISATQPPKKCNKLELDNNLDFTYSPILTKESDDLTLNTERVTASIWQNRDTETATSKKEDYHSNNSSDDNDNENCFHQITVTGPLDKNNACSDDELEEGEVLTDEENESVAAVATAAAAPVRSPVRYKSFSPLECRKSPAKRYREDCRKRPCREPMKSYPHNRQRSSPNRFVSKTHCPLVTGKHSRHRDGRSSQNRVYSSGSGSGSRSQSRRLDSHHRQSGFRYMRSSSSANRKRRTH